MGARRRVLVGGKGAAAQSGHAEEREVVGRHDFAAYVLGVLGAGERECRRRIVRYPCEVGGGLPQQLKPGERPALPAQGLMRTGATTVEDGQPPGVGKGRLTPERRVDHAERGDEGADTHPQHGDHGQRERAGPEECTKREQHGSGRGCHDREMPVAERRFTGEACGVASGCAEPW